CSRTTAGSASFALVVRSGSRSNLHRRPSSTRIPIDPIGVSTNAFIRFMFCACSKRRSYRIVVSA
ncbi:MAG: hypothetical protein, partial [Olavius algarvensis Gamma 1 endosymbiont]